ncbi:2-dehydropantoate 2-reductase [Pseudoalteromonas sp. BDTF-M6]|uniref:ketopantoate reductase family protein n=1 Tax=Pseudoalteromonas sp. BDTF-M6 TaxID=2796132 RepID=UPI001BB058E6|nr:2-dehydropantoate 2-reductase [Pseudoalteromonas sp. BDTF-M6]MBS3798375.1 2-dehydropantoate 2-reductase [Pseudoalteromonas sp. BDTF-M6]
MAKKEQLTPVYILGPGALGLAFAKLFSDHRPVTLLTKPHHPQRYQYSYQAHSEALQVQSCPLPSGERVPQQISELWLFTKAHQVVEALTALLPALKKDAQIIISHNGMSDLNELNQLLGPQQALYFMLTQQAAYKPAADKVVHVSQGLSTLGAANKVAQQCLARQLPLWQQQIPNLVGSDNIHRARWQKLLVNLAINPVATWRQQRNGALRAPEYASDIMALMQEAIGVARAQGLDFSLLQALNLAYRVMAQTADNRCSMLQDKLLGRETEIDAMCGYVSKTAQQLGLAAPVNQLYYQRIKGDTP